MKLNVLIADKLDPTTVSDLEAIGAAVRLEPELSADDLPGAIGQTEVLVVRSTKVNAATIGAAPNLALIVRAGAGVNTIDMDEASRRGIAVANCPGKNTAAVAELTIGLLIAADRRIPAATADLAGGRWRKKEYQAAGGLLGRTLSVIGLGAIGKAVAARAQGLGMNVRAWSRSLTEEQAEEMNLEYAATPEAAVAGADAVSVHLASTGETRDLFGRELFAAMQEGAIFINTSRGEVVDAQALRWAIENRNIRASLDVYPDEPAGGQADYADTELIASLAAATPHIGASTAQAAEAIAAEVVRIVRAYVETGKPLNCVNIRARGEEEASLVVRHYNHVGVLAGVLDELRNSGINVEEMENAIFHGAATASCTLKLDTAPDQASLERIQAGESIIQVALK
jgi:D-3-phosphoglycerate dehydrogenase / 2-oxoglutarate reductase